METTKELSPKFLDDIYGQPHAVTVLKRFAENPEHAHKCLLLHGPYGTGKTSAAKAFALAVNQIQPDEIDSYSYCYNCATLEYEINNQSSLPTHDFISSNLPLLTKGWGVGIFDEIQGAGSHIQTSLLTYIESVHNKSTFFVFCTTDITGVLPTLRSRCLPIDFKSISYDDVYKNLDDNGRKNGLDIPDEIKTYIAAKCNGHMRDAHIQLNKYLNVGKDVYFAGANSYYGLIADMFIAAYRGDKDSLVKYLKELSYNPLFTVRSEFENFIMDCANTKYLGEKSHISEVNRLLDEYGDNFTDIVDFYAGIWDNSLFSSDRHFYMHMLSFFKDLERKRATA